MADNTTKKQPADHLKEYGFKRGQSGNPKGRPKGSRNRLGEQFLGDLLTLWEDEGKAALLEARTQKPMEFVKIVASVLPKEILVQTSPIDDMTDEELDDAINLLLGTIEDLRAGEKPGFH